VLDRTSAFHGRVASREQIQVEITIPQHKVWPDLFVRWWDYGFRSWRYGAGPDALLSFACELGPRPYAITDRKGNDTTDRWEDALLIKSLARDLFERTAIDTQLSLEQGPLA